MRRRHTSPLAHTRPRGFRERLAAAGYTLLGLFVAYVIVILVIAVAIGLYRHGFKGGD